MKRLIGEGIVDLREYRIKKIYENVQPSLDLSYLLYKEECYELLYDVHMNVDNAISEIMTIKYDALKKQA